MTGADSATLRAAIDPEGEAVTNYHFNWGTGDSYGNTTPSPAGTLPTGGQAVAVSEDLSGLTPGQTYHYQLVATNGTGTTTGEDRTFTVQSPGLGPKRGYEIVSQNPTGGVPLLPTLPQSQISPDGNHVVFTSAQPLPGASAPLFPDHLTGTWLYESTRGAAGWRFHPLGLASPALDSGAAPSFDMSRVGIATEYPGDPDDQNGTWDTYLLNPDGSLTWVSRDPRIPVGTPQTAPGPSGQFIGLPLMNTDGSTVVFNSERQLLDEDTNPGFDTYTWHEGQLSFGMPAGLEFKPV